MSFQVASGGGYTNTSPAVTTYPFCMGGWAMCNSLPAANGAQCFFSLGNSGVSRTAAGLFIIADSGGTPTWNISIDNGTSFQSTFASGIVAVVNSWAYVIGRFISATNRRIAVYQANGLHGTGSGVTNVTFSGATRLTIGIRADQTVQNFSGYLQDLWWSDSDIFVDSTQDYPDDQQILIAQRTPLAVPWVAPKLIDFIPLRANNVALTEFSRPYRGGKYGDTIPKWSGLNTGTMADGPAAPTLLPMRGNGAYRIITPSTVRPRSFGCIV